MIDGGGASSGDAGGDAGGPRLLDHVTALSGGDGFTCALIEDGTVWCWGLNLDGILWQSPSTRSPRPVKVTAISQAKAISAGNNHACVLSAVAGGTVLCWGNDALERLGDPQSSGSLTPAALPGWAGTSGSVGAGGLFSCAWPGDDSTPECWGEGIAGQLGDGRNFGSDSPRSVVGLGTANGHRIAQLAVGPAHSCVVLADHSVECWGQGVSGELGNGIMSAQNMPVPVTGLDDAVGVACGFDHTCALRAGGTVSCWGSNRSGQLGDGSLTPAATPVTVVGLSNAVAIGAGDKISCALLADGTAHCWGASSGGQPTPSPVSIPGLTDAVRFTLGYGHGCAILKDTTVRCWGGNDDGELGNGETSVVPPPGAVAVLAGDAPGAAP